VFYEEGTWTPELTGKSTAGEYTLDVSLASYIRVGRKYEVHLNCSITDIVSAGSGYAQIAGLPANKASGEIFTATPRFDNIDLPADAIYITTTRRFSGGSDSILFSIVRDNDTASLLNISNFAVGSSIRMNLTYFA
jgi:hypothetical protein